MNGTTSMGIDINYETIKNTTSDTTCKNRGCKLQRESASCGRCGRQSPNLIKKNV